MTRRIPSEPSAGSCCLSANLAFFATVLFALPFILIHSSDFDQNEYWLLLHTPNPFLKYWFLAIASSWPIVNAKLTVLVVQIQLIRRHH